MSRCCFFILSIIFSPHFHQFLKQCWWSIVNSHLAVSLHSQIRATSNTCIAYRWSALITIAWNRKPDAIQSYASNSAWLIESPLTTGMWIKIIMSDVEARHTHAINRIAWIWRIWIEWNFSANCHLSSIVSLRTARLYTLVHSFRANKSLNYVIIISRTYVFS